MDSVVGSIVLVLGLEANKRHPGLDQSAADGLKLVERIVAHNGCCCCGCFRSSDCVVVLVVTDYQWFRHTLSLQTTGIIRKTMEKNKSHNYLTRENDSAGVWCCCQTVLCVCESATREETHFSCVHQTHDCFPRFTPTQTQGVVQLMIARSLLVLCSLCAFLSHLVLKGSPRPQSLLLSLCVSPVCS